MEIASYAVSGKKTVKLVCVTGDNNNKYYNMYEQGNNTFIVQYGRIKGTETTHTYGMNEWDKIYRAKTKKGYNDVTHLFAEAVKVNTAKPGNTAEISQISNFAIKMLFDELQAFAKKTVAANYTVSQADVTQAQVDAAQGVLSELSLLLGTNFDIDRFNNSLLKLYMIIPRKMSNVQYHLLSKDLTTTKAERSQKLIEQEQDLLDIMAGQVLMIQKQNTTISDKEEDTVKSMDMLEMLGLTVSEANSDDILTIKKLMGPNSGQFRKAFKVQNIKTETDFQACLSKATNKTTELFWHGSRNENWFNIIQTGLLIRPSGAVYSGSMFGDGIYGANKAQKSIGYTSLNGSYWAKGGSNKAFLALFEFHTGNQKHIYRHDSSCYKLSRNTIGKEGFDSVYAHGGIDLRNDEFIVYDARQVTIKYIIEISN